MKILYVTTISNTINAFLIPHIRMLIDKGHKVDVAFRIDQEVDREIYKMNCKIHQVDFNRSLLKNNYHNLIQEIKTLITSENYEVVHTHTPIASAIVRIACRNIEGVKVIYTAHGFHFFNGSSILNWLTFYPIEKALSPYTDLLITINKEDYERAQTFKAKSVKHIPGVGINLNDIQVNKKKILKIKKELKLSKDDFVLCSIGELNKNKNHIVVLEAMKKLDKNNIKLIIAGTGDLRKKLIKRTKELNLEDQVFFLGFRDDIYELLELSDVFIFPSYREGLSRSLMEAMAMGKAVIVSKIRGNQDLIDENKGGLFFNSNDADQLSKHILTMLMNYNFRETASNYNKEKVKQYSLENVLSKMLEIYY